jgi:PDZ domain-containing secreted protein
MRLRLAVLSAALAATGAAWWNGLLPCEVVSVQPDCQLLVTGGPVLETGDLVTIVGAGPLRIPAGRLLATTIEVAEPQDRAEWWVARRDPTVSLVARDLLVPAGSGLAEVAAEGQVRMLESQQLAAALALHRSGRIPSPEAPVGLWPVEVRFATDGVGGPSAGLMLALAIHARLAETDPTARSAASGGPLVVAGTGALGADGEILGVGGIDHKLRSVASENGPAGVPDAFLLPMSDLAAARRVEGSARILLVPVSSLEDAIAALIALRDGSLPVGGEWLGTVGSAGR